MKTISIFLLSLCLIVPLGLGQTAERAPADGKPSISIPRGPGQSPGQCCWSRDAGLITGDARCLGIEFDDGQKEHYWVSGSGDFSKAYLYEIDQSGTLVNTYPQPSGNWGFWGWRDLAWDYFYLYAGDDSAMPGFITQISTVDGLPTGVNYGPFPVVPCRALAYEREDDCFWTASWSSNIYQCFRDGSFVAYPNILMGVYGMAIEESDVYNPVLWIWSQDGAGAQATAFDPQTGIFLPTTFDPCPIVDGLAAGACAYPTCNGEWEMAAMHQTISDTYVGYCLHDPCPLLDDVCGISALNGGFVNFTLMAGPSYGNQDYLLLGSMSGWYPGTAIPWTSCPLRANWDFFMWINILNLGTIFFDDFMGTLDPKGHATAQFFLPKGSGIPEGRLHFAYLLGSPNDYVSNPVEVWIGP